MKRKNLSERRMIVEGVVTIAGKMTGNFEDADCDGTTFFKMASKRGKRSKESEVCQAARNALKGWGGLASGAN